MAKKHKKKGQKSKSGKASKKQTQKQTPQSSNQKKVTQKESVRIATPLSEKIRLDNNEHSYRHYFNHRYGKYTRKVRKPVLVALKIFFAGLSIFLCLAAAGLVMLFLVFGRDLPDVSKLKDMNFSETTVIYDREGNVLYSIYDEENRKYVPLEYISRNVVYGTLAIEDKHFFSHMGFDVFGIIRAQLKNIEDDRLTQGASTITQQLARNIFLSPEKTYERKIKELLLALEIEWMFSKDEILEMYLNKIPYGTNAFGIEAASKTYFGKSSKDLTLVESVVIASLPKAPSYYSPYGQNRKLLMGYCQEDELDTVVTNGTQELSPDMIQDDPEEMVGDEAALAPVATPDIAETQETSTQETQDLAHQAAAQQGVCKSPSDPRYIKGRKDQVLDRMVEDGYITEEEALEAWRDGFSLTFRDPKHRIEAPHFVFYIKELLEQKYGKEMVESGGLEVITTLDPRLQSIAQDVVEKQAPINLRVSNANNSSLVAIDPKTGQILAMVGSVDYWNPDIDGQVNVATALRQPGSAFKPLIYAAAIQNGGLGSGSILLDTKTVFPGNYIPHDSDNKYKGRLTMRQALATSRNVTAIKAFYIAGGEDKILEYMDKMGVTSLRKFKDEFNIKAKERGWTFNFGPALAIGSGEISLLELTAGYSVLANGGLRMPATPILEVRDRNGNVLEKYEAKGEQVLDPQAAYIVNNIISDVSARPAGSWRAALTMANGRTATAKTGTSNKKIGRVNVPNNLLTAGYTPSLAAAVWTGNTDGKQVSYNSWGFNTAAVIWKNFMEEALKDLPDEPFPEPPGIKHVGKELFPSYATKTNYEKLFKKAGSQESQDKDKDEDEKKEEEAPVVPPSSFILGNGDITPPRVVEPTHPVEAPATGNKGTVTYGF